MTEFRIGSWVVDLERGIATEGNVTVTLVPKGNQAFALHFSPAISADRQNTMEQEVLSVFERANLLAERQDDQSSDRIVVNNNM